jgi:hypothetical protein
MRKNPKFETSTLWFFSPTLQAPRITDVGQEKQTETGRSAGLKFSENRVQKKTEYLNLM